MAIGQRNDLGHRTSGRPFGLMHQRVRYPECQREMVPYIVLSKKLHGEQCNIVERAQLIGDGQRGSDLPGESE